MFSTCWTTVSCGALSPFGTKWYLVYFTDHQFKQTMQTKKIQDLKHFRFQNKKEFFIW